MGTKAIGKAWEPGAYEARHRTAWSMESPQNGKKKLTADFAPTPSSHSAQGNQAAIKAVWVN